MLDVTQLCMGCMEHKGPDTLCPHCSYQDGTPVNSPLHLLPRTELHGQYLVGRVLGHGGFGITYLGWDLNLERKIAIKEYLPSGVAIRHIAGSEVLPFSPESRKDFDYGLEKYLEEGRTLARFQTHPSIVSVLNFFRANGTAYLVMEYLDGATLQSFLEENNGKTDMMTMLRVMVPVFEALSSVHNQGILHRDISPDNIFITRKWGIKVLDFGAARYALGQKSRNLSVILKEGYAPVEQYHSKGNQGPWTDIYACGATIYRTLTGKIPPAALDRMQSDELVPPSSLGIEIPPDQERAILKSLAVRPDGRFASVNSFRDALTGVAPLPDTLAKTQISQSLPPPSPSPDAVPVSQQPALVISTSVPTPPSRPIPRWILALAAALLLALIVIAINLRLGDQRRSLEAEKQHDITRVRLEEELQRQKGLDAENEKRRIERQKEEETLRLQQAELDQKQLELEKERNKGKALSYDDHIRQSVALARAGNLSAALHSAQLALKLNPSRPEAYSSLGWVALYQNSDLKSAASHYREAITRGGIAWFRVSHDHTNLSFTDACSGDFGIARDRIEFKALNQVHSFLLPRSEIKELQANKENSKSAGGDFHLKAAAKNFNFLPSPDPKAVRDIILQLAAIK